MKIWLIIATIAGITIALVAGIVETKLADPYATPSVYRWPIVIPKPEGAALRAPAGFHIEVFAEGFERPRFMTLGPRNEVLLSDSNGGVTPSISIRQPSTGPPLFNGSVYVLTGPGKRKKLVGNLDRPYGLAFWRDYLYIAEAGSVKRYKYDPNSLSVGSGQEIISLKGLEDFHWTRTLLFDRAERKLYVSIGSGSNVVIGEDPRRATICRSNPDGSEFEIFATGLRNPVGLRWYPGTDTLWTTVQERDDLGDELVPDFFTHIEPHGFYGWPYAYIGPNPDPQNSGLRLLRHLIRRPYVLPQYPKLSTLVKSTIRPDYLLGAHVAVLDSLFYTGEQFPQEYRGGAFLAFHGSSNRSRHIGFSVAFIPFKDRKPSGPVREVVTGWMLSPDKDEVWGRPVGLLQLTDGSLLVSDDGGTKIWRISYKR